MSSSKNTECLQRLRNAVAVCLHFWAALVILTLFGVSSAFGQATYSDSWFDDSGAGSIASAGVTDGSYTHSYVVDTTVSSPNSRTAFGSRRRTGYARADVALAWDWDDPGEYFTDSEHWARCPGDDLNYYSIGTTADSILTGISHAEYVKDVQYADGTGHFVPIAGCNVTCMPSSFTGTLICPSQPEYRLRLQVWYQTPVGIRVCVPGSVTYTTPANCVQQLAQCYESEL
jgi:hypothetical protein